MDNQEYAELAQKKAPASKVLRNCVNAFIYGGAICVIGQIFFSLYKGMGISEDASSALVSVTLIFASALLTGIGVYDSIAKRAGAGTIVPITGFANSVVSPAIEAKTEGYILGVGAKIFTIAGPVIAFGTLSSFAAGIIYYIISRM